MTNLKMKFILALVLVLSTGFTCQKKYPIAKPAESESAEPADSSEPPVKDEETKSSDDN